MFLEIEPLGDEVAVVDQVEVADSDAFRYSRRTRSVDDIDQVLGSGPGVRIGDRLLVPELLIAAQAEYRAGKLRHLCQKLRFGDECDGSAELLRQARLGII